MNTAILIGLALSVALLLWTIRHYERRVERLEADLDFATGLLASDLDDRIGR